MTQITDGMLRQELMTRRGRLATAMLLASDRVALEGLLQQVDGALARMGDGTYGLCTVCHDTVEADRLAADPLLTLCIDHLDAEGRRALELDLETAARVQAALLPRPDLSICGWEVNYRYQPARLVSGDYLDLIPTAPLGDDLWLVFGDVSGKGVAASMLMSHLKATFRALLAAGPPLTDLVATASRIFCESTLAAHFATLVCARLAADGSLELVNAGHNPPLVVCPQGVRRLAATGLPVGMFAGARYTAVPLTLDEGETLLLYTDGLTEGTSSKGEEYGIARLERVVAAHADASAEELTAACLADFDAFRGATPRGDDLTVLAIRRWAAAGEARQRSAA